MPFAAGTNMRTTITSDWVKSRGAFLLYMKDPLRPGERIDEDGEGLIYVIGYNKEQRLQCVADELEEGVLNAMMPEYLKRRFENALEEKGHGSSRRRRSENPVRYRWIFLEPPPSCSQMLDVLSRNY